MVKIFLYYNKYELFEFVFWCIEVLMVEGLLEVVNEMFVEEYFFILIYR